MENEGKNEASFIDFRVVSPGAPDTGRSVTNWTDSWLKSQGGCLRLEEVPEVPEDWSEYC